MKLLRNVFLILLLFILSAAGCVFYAFKIEPYRLKTNEYTINKTQSDSTPVKIIQISDLHIKEDFTCKRLEKVVNKVNSQNPDIILFTGDLYDNYAAYSDDENITAALKELKAAHGKIAVWGNRDYGGGASRQYESIMREAGFTLLKNENLSVTLNDQKKILFTGLDDSLLGHPLMPYTAGSDDSDYSILLTHEPDIIDEYMDNNYDLVLSGHSHGGQINIPFLPAVNEKAVETTALSTRYSGGMYHLKEDPDTTLYVNTGIGTTHISARFGVVPEVAVFYVSL